MWKGWDIMKICGLQKTTLLDFPGHVAATIFTGGCNFRCPFCHNSDLLGSDAPAAFTDEEVLDFLKKRRGILEGAAITGGEPTLQPDLEDFIQKVRALGYQIKLDTNGSHPWILKKLIKNKMIDMVAMDIKSSKESYARVAGSKHLDLKPICESVDFLMSGSVPYEFRTTVVRELHTQEDFRSIGNWLAGCSAYYLQAYKDSPEVIRPGFSSYSKRDLDYFCLILSRTIPAVYIRGID